MMSQPDAPLRNAAAATADQAAPVPRKASTPAAEQEHFIPVRKSDLIQKLSSPELLPDDQRSSFVGLCRLLEATFHYRFHREFEQLKDDYAPFDPDAVSAVGDASAPSADARLAGRLFDRFRDLVVRANYVQLEREEIEQAIGAASEWGVRLNLDLDVFEQLEVYSRGDVIGQRERQRWQNLYRTELVDVPIYERLVVIFRLRRDQRIAANVIPDTVYIKLFKNIPKQDVDMLLPGSHVKMTLLDQGRILLPTVSGIVISLFKVVKLLAFASLYGMFAFLAAVGGTIGYGAKSFFGYIRTKDKYQHHLTRSLYYQNLDNNSGVLFRMLDEAEEQEFREAIIAYFLLWREAGRPGWTARQVDRRAEALLFELADIRVDFEVEDALGKLQRLGLATSDSEGRWTAVPVAEALRQLDAAWDDYFQYNNSPPGETPA